MTAALRLPIDCAIDPRLDAFRTHLPKEEFAALAAWCTTFYPFQLDWLLEPADMAISNKSRQIGGSYTTAAVCVLWGVFCRQFTTVISTGKPESKEVLDKCARHVRILQALGSKFAATLRSNQDDIGFASGGRILALPSSGGRSFSGNVFLDEFAYQIHASEVWEAAAPVTLHDYKLRVMSTPNGVGNEFYNLWSEAIKEGSGWAAHEVPLQKAIDQGFDVDIAKCWKIAKQDPRLFDQFFNCSFLDSVMQYLSMEKINACRTTTVLEANDKGEYFAGLDIGREADLSCLTVVKTIRGVSDIVHVETMKRTDSDGLEAMVGWAMKRYNLRRICIDSTGLGTFPAERMKNKHGDRVDVSYRRNRVESVDFTAKSKEALATNAYTAMTDGRVRLPDGDVQLPSFERRNEDDKGNKIGEPITVNPPGTARLLRTELASIRRVVTLSGNITYDTPRTDSGHGDRAWALLLALFAVDKVHPMVAALQARAGIR